MTLIGQIRLEPIWRHRPNKTEGSEGVTVKTFTPVCTHGTKLFMSLVAISAITSGEERGFDEVVLFFFFLSMQLR